MDSDALKIKITKGGKTQANVLQRLHQGTLKAALKEVDLGATVTVDGHEYIVIHKVWNVTVAGADLVSIELEEKKDG